MSSKWRPRTWRLLLAFVVCFCHWTTAAADTPPDEAATPTPTTAPATNDSAPLQDEIDDLRANLTDVWRAMTALSRRLEAIERADKEDDRDDDDGRDDEDGGAASLQHCDDKDDGDDQDVQRGRNTTDPSLYAFMKNSTSQLGSLIDKMVAGRQPRGGGSGDDDDDDDKDDDKEDHDEKDDDDKEDGSGENQVRRNGNGHDQPPKRRSRKCPPRGGNRRTSKTTEDDPTEGPSRNITAYCNMRPNKALPPERRADVRGRIYLVQQNRRQLRMDFKISGLPEVAGNQGRNYGMHVHEFGNLTNGCESAGYHYNPFNFNHSAPTSPKRHLGDLGNLQSDERGIVDSSLHFNIDRALNGPHSFIGRAIVIHEMEDDLGSKPEDPGSLTHGNSGARLACCVIHKLN